MSNSKSDTILCIKNMMHSLPEKDATKLIKYGLNNVLSVRTRNKFSQKSIVNLTCESCGRVYEGCGAVSFNSCECYASFCEYCDGFCPCGDVCLDCCKKCESCNEKFCDEIQSFKFASGYTVCNGCVDEDYEWQLPNIKDRFCKDHIRPILTEYKKVSNTVCCKCFWKENRWKYIHLQK